MPYGFNDDKSAYDLSNIVDMISWVGNYTTDGVTGAVISSYNAACFGSGETACVAGNIAFTSISASAGWLKIGTIDHPAAADTLGTCAIGRQYNYNAAGQIKVGADGGVYFNYNDKNPLPTIIVFNVPYRAAQ